MSGHNEQSPFVDFGKVETRKIVEDGEVTTGFEDFENYEYHEQPIEIKEPLWKRLGQGILKFMDLIWPGWDGNKADGE